MSSREPDRVFLGFRYMAPDYFQYLGFIREARDARNPILLANPFTGEPQGRRYVLLYFSLLGILARLSSISIQWLWFICQAIVGFMYIVMFYIFVGSFLQSRGRRAGATALFALGGGASALYFLLAREMDLAQRLRQPLASFWNWSTFGTLQEPNWAFAAAALILACHALIRGGWKWNVSAAALMLAVWFIHPYSGMVAYLALFLVPVMPITVAVVRLEPIPWLRVRENLWRCLPALLSFAGIVLYLWWARRDEVYRITADGAFYWNCTFEAGWYFIAYGALVPLSIIGLSALLREPGTRCDVLAAFMLAALMLSINPWIAACKFQFLLFPPLVVTGAVGLFALSDRYRIVHRLTSTVWGVALLVPIFGLDAPAAILKSVRPNLYSDEQFMPRADIDAMRFMQTLPPGIIFSSVQSGNLLPWFSSHRVFVGHWFLTINCDKKADQANRFFHLVVSVAEKQELLRGSRARYVYYGRYEQRQGTVDSRLHLHQLYDRKGIQIYEVPG